MLPPTPSTAATGLTSPVAVTITVSPELAEAAGTLASDVPATAAITAAPAATIRRFFRRASRVRLPATAFNDLAYGIRKSPSVCSIP